MQCAVKKFAESKENGLCLIDMPTGTGKTYQAKELIKKIIKGEELRDIGLVIYLTPLRKNIDDIYNELKEDFKDDLESFDNNVLRIYSNYECVIENLLDVENQIPLSLKRKESFKQLKSKISVYKALEKQADFTKDLLSTTLKEIRTNYEPQFRHDLELELHKEAKTKVEKIKKINHEYPWVKILYPSCLTEGRKVLFMTMDKFLFGNDPIVTKPYRFLSYAKIKSSLIFIDEFDATKDVILNQEIERCTDFKIDLAKLFSGITTAIKGTQAPEALFGGSDESKASFEKMKKVMLDIEKQFNLDFIFKLESNSNDDRYFLFDDYQIHTITSGDKENNISVKNDPEKNQNTILIGKKDDGLFYRAIYAMKGALNYFIHCCAMMSRNYLNKHNEIAIANHGDMMEIEQAVSTIIDYFNLDSELAKTVSSLIVDDISLPVESRKRDAFSTDFYMDGFRYFDFNDDISHDVSTSIAMCYLDNTPEKFIISLCSKAKVVGLSATASIKSVTGNYNLEYIEAKLKSDYYKLPTEDKSRISEYVNNQLSNNYSIDVCKISLKGEKPDEISKTLFSIDGNVEKSTGLFQHYVDESAKNPHYDNVRLGKVLLAIRKFLENKDSKVLLVLTNKNIRTQDPEDSFSLPLINSIIQDFCAELKIKNPKCHCLFGNDFDKEKESYQSEVKEGNKVILFSSYPSVGTGQNLQYDMSIDDNFKKQKDIDSIYVELPTNIIVHNQNLKDEGSLNKYIYQMETLRANGEISPFSSMGNIKSAFKQYMNPVGKYVNFDNMPYKCASTNNHKVKILVQAIGRICRTKEKSSDHKVSIYVDNEIMSSIDFGFMKSRTMNPEFRKIVELSNLEPAHDLETIVNLNKAMDCNLRIEKRIDNILSNNKVCWIQEDMDQWNLIRDIIIKYPTISKAKLDELSTQDGLESIKDFYLFGNDGKKLFCYIYNKDNNKRAIKFGSNIEKDNGDILIDARSSRLFDLLSSYNVRKHFEKNGYATSFEANECMILPVVFQNIYKGAIGEQAGKAILESHGIKLQEITDPSKFEKFDFCLAKNNDIYIDFKNWSENDRENRDGYKTKSLKKLESIKGKKAFIINVLSSEFNMHESDNIVEISSLFKFKNGRYYELGFDMSHIHKKIEEACKHGN